MKRRGHKYWAWADCRLHSRQLTEDLSNGRCLEVKVRSARSGETQMFIGIYRSGGAVDHEEYYAVLLLTLDAALIFGLDRARALAAGTGVAGQSTFEELQAPAID